MIKLFILYNWIVILILTAFAIMLKTTVYLDKRTVKRMCILINMVFVLSLTVFVEFYLGQQGLYKPLRLVLMAVRYSATPLIIAMTLYTLVKKERWYIFVPAVVVAAANIISTFSGVVFSIDSANALKRGPLGYLPFVAVGFYSVFLLVTLFLQSNKQASEIIPILYLALSFVSGLVMPFVLQKDYSQIFCPTIAIALFVYYDFSILQISKKDPLTGVLNRQAYEAAIAENDKNITAVLTIDMNGLKPINDIEGHAAGDEALVTVALCFMRATKPKQLVYRIGGDEFTILCRRSSQTETKHLVDRIQRNISGTKYSCAIGYSCSPDGEKPIEEMIKESDEMMYAKKEKHYALPINERYRG